MATPDKPTILIHSDKSTTVEFEVVVQGLSKSIKPQVRLALHFDDHCRTYNCELITSEDKKDKNMWSVNVP